MGGTNSTEVSPNEATVTGSRLSGSNNVNSNALPTLMFHTSHSENIRLSRDAAVSRRIESFCKGISFTNRPVKINEKIYLKIAETSTSWSGVLRFGFTNNDPSNVRPSSLPKYSCPDMTNKQGNWGKALAERYAARDNILYFYVTQSGDVIYGVNGEEKGTFISGVDTSHLLWALIDVYGNTIAIEILDPNQHMNNNRRRDNPQTETDNVTSSLNTMTISESPSPASRFHENASLATLPFHATTKGHNVCLSQGNKCANRKQTEFSHGYVFTCRPLNIGENFIVKVTKTDETYAGSAAFGLTSCDPSKVSPRELPDDSDHLLDRQEYWVVSKDVAATPKKDDELCFRINELGEVRFQKNNLAPVTIMHVDHSQKLWAFINVFGNTTGIKSLGTFRERSRRQSSPRNTNSSQSNISNHPLYLPPDIISSGDGSQDNMRNECAVCYERAIDCVLYTCGHMCMCFECAVQQWRGDGGGQCPICRAMIRDVIRIYKS